MTYKHFRPTQQELSHPHAWQTCKMCIFQCFHLFLKLLFHVFIYAKFKSQLISFYFIAIFHTKVLYFGLDLDLGCVFFFVCLFILALSSKSFYGHMGLKFISIHYCFCYSVVDFTMNIYGKSHKTLSIFSLPPNINIIKAWTS